MDKLKSKTIQGLAYLGMAKGAGKLISFVNTIVLARLLTPKDYGLMAIVMVIVGFVGFFNEIGLGSAIKHRAEITSNQINGAFTIALFVSIGLYGMMYLASPAIASYYNSPALVDILHVVASTFIIGAIGSVPDALLARDMRFKVYAGIDFMMIILQCAITLVLAWIGQGVWALVWGFIFSQVFKSACVFYFSGWRPEKLGDLRAATELMKFGASVTYSRVTWYIYSNANTPIIGKVLSAQKVGIYSMAAGLASLPTAHITSLVIRIAAPLFSRLQTEPMRLENALLRLTAGIALMTFPMMIGMMLTAEQLVPVLLGPNWLETIFPLQILCVMGLVKSIDPLITQAFISVNKANITARYTTLCACVIPISVYFGASLGGLIGVAIALVISYPTSSIYLFYCAHKHLNISLKRYFIALRSPIENTVGMALSVICVQFLFQNVLSKQIWTLLLLKVATGALCYLVLLIYGRRDSLQMLQEVASDLGISKDRLSHWPFTRLKKES
jgi:O-antigen/teichoic acid export membrane protein